MKEIVKYTLSMFQYGEIWAYPTDTSFGLGVRADDPDTLQRLFECKRRVAGKYFSLMVRDWNMLHDFAEVPSCLEKDFFFEKPRTVILKPKNSLPASSFWPLEKVAFRISTILEVAEVIEYPITATSANISGDEPIFESDQIQKQWSDKIMIFPGFESLSFTPPSEIWDFTEENIIRLR